MSHPTDPHRFTPDERRASLWLAAVYGLRMLGLFLILPVFAVHAHGMPGGSNLALVGLAIGIYGLTQALLQLPFGIASDRYGRQPVIIGGLLVFALGSFVAAAATDLLTVVIGRALQGAGAVSAAVSALLADRTRDTVRTKAMAMVGASIGLAFVFSLVAAPLLYGWIGMSGLFALTGVLALGAVWVVWRGLPPAPATAAEPTAASRPWSRTLRHPELLRLNLGIFVLQAVLMAMFVVVPLGLTARLGLPVQQHGWVYLPVLLASFLLMLPPLLWGERRGRVRAVFLAAITLLLLSQLALALAWESAAVLVASLLAFFIGFNLLEASLPSLVSRFTSPQTKGLALGIYNTAQSLGLFTGGLLGGWLAQRAGAPALFYACAGLLVLWLAVAWAMQAPARRGTPAALAADQAG